MTKNAGNLLIHIGYAKAGSSWLQQYFKAPGSGFLGPDKNREYFPLTDFVQDNALSFDAERYKKALQTHCEAAKTQGLVPVLTSERFAGHWFSGGYDTKEIAARLHACAADAKILIIFREQVKMLTSVYRQYVKKGGARSLEKFLFPPEEGRMRIPEFSFAYFNYDLIISCYQEQFGPKNVLALPLEYIEEAPEDAFKAIQNFAGANTGENFRISPQRRNIGISAIEAALKRRLNIFLRADSINDHSPLHNPVTKTIANGIYKGISMVLTEDMKKNSNKKLEGRIRKYAENRYCDSNKRTAEMVKMDLSKYGYMG